MCAYSDHIDAPHISPLVATNGKNFVAIGCPTGIYVLHRNESRPKPRKVLQLPNPKSLHALQEFNRFIILFDGGLHAYSLDLLGRVALQLSTPQSLDASLERISEPDAVVMFAKAGRVGPRTLRKCYALFDGKHS